MNRSTVIAVAAGQGWTRCGGFRRYGPDWFECFRKGNKFCWIGFSKVCGAPDDVASGWHKEPLDYSNGISRADVREWFQ